MTWVARIASCGIGAACLFLLACDSDTTSPPEVPVLVDRIVFENRPPTQSENVFHVGLSGGEVVQLTEGAASNRCPVVSPDGKQIAFSSGSSLLVMDVDGTHKRDLVPSLTLSDARLDCPAWSPDGQKLAVVRRVARVKLPGTSELYLVNVDGTGIVHLASGDTFYSVEWSPLGNELLFGSASYSSGPYDFAVNIIKLDGTGLRRIPQQGNGYDWAPDGKQVAFTCGTELVRRLCVVQADGTGATTLTDAVSASSVDWAPDGKHIAFTCGVNVCTINPDGTGFQTLVSRSGSNGSPVWSPDARLIVYHCSTPALTLCAVNADGSADRTLATLSGDSYNPSFSPVSH